MTYPLGPAKPDAVPRRIEETASPDGASSWRAFRPIPLPLAIAPPILPILIRFIRIWNDLLFELVPTNSNNVRPIMVARAGTPALRLGK